MTWAITQSYKGLSTKSKNPLSNKKKEKNTLFFLLTPRADTHEDSFFVRVRWPRGGGEHKSTGGSNWRDSS